MSRLRCAAVSAAVVVGLLTAACNGSDDDSANTTTTTGPPSTTSTTAVDVSTIPATIDVAYVQRVFDVLDQVRGEVVKEFLAKRQLTPDMAARLSAAYSPQELHDQLAVLPELLNTDPALLRQPLGFRRIEVRGLLTARSDCVLAEVTFNVTAVVTNSPPPSTGYLRLERIPTSSRGGANASPFWIADQDNKPSIPCASL